MRSRSSERGFGIPELLISIVVLGVGLVAVAGLAVTTMDRTRADALRTDQLIVAQQALERIVARQFDSLVTGTDSTTTAFGTYTLGTSVGTAGPRSKRLTLTVSGLGSTPPLSLGVTVARSVALP